MNATPEKKHLHFEFPTNKKCTMSKLINHKVITKKYNVLGNAVLLFRLYRTKINEQKTISWLRFGHATELWKNYLYFDDLKLKILKSLTPFTGKLMQSSKSCQSPACYGTHQVELWGNFLNNLWGLGTEKELGCRSGPPDLHRLAESVPWNRFLGSLKV